MVSKLALSIIVGLILTVIIVATLNVGIALFMNNPEYDDFCDFKTQESPTTIERCEELGGEWNPEGKTYPRAIPVDASPELIDGYCDLYSQCQEEYNNARDSFNQKRFYIFAAVGFILLLVGLFSRENLIQITGLASGGILVFEGIVSNWESELIVFIALLLILVIFGMVAYRVIRKKK